MARPHPHALARAASPNGADSVHRRRPAGRSRARGPFLAIGLLLATTGPALAATARVPEDFPTIQAAVDHVAPYPEPDTVFVRAGSYAEHVVTHEPLCLKAVPAPGSLDSTVKIDGLDVHPQKSRAFGTQVIGIHVAGSALTAPSDGPDRVEYEHCRFDGGMAGWGYYPDLDLVSMRHCVLFGAVSLVAWNTVVDSCAIYGPVSMLAAGAAVVTNNVFENVPGFAASIFSDQEAHIVGNVVSGGGGGFDVRTSEDGPWVEDNRVEGCAGTGIRIDANFYAASIERNHISHC